VLHGGPAHLLHGGAQFDAQELEHALDAGLPERSQPPQIRPADRVSARCASAMLFEEIVHGGDERPVIASTTQLDVRVSSGLQFIAHSFDDEILSRLGE